MRMKLLALPAALLLFALHPAFATTGEKGTWELGPYVGYAWPDDFDPANPDHDWLFGFRFGRFFSPVWSIEGSLQHFSTDADTTSAGAGFTQGDFTMDSFRANLLYNFRPGHVVRPFVTAGLGAEKVDADDLGSDTSPGFNIGGGLRWFFTEHFGLRGDLRFVTYQMGGDIDQRENNWEETVGLVWAFGGAPPADSDGDGLDDKKDKCPNTPKGATIDLSGCPIDSDKDGVYDGLDKCPDTPKGWPVDAKGCPRDSDGDNVSDGADQCPDTPKYAKVDPKGCPIDSDGDGVYDGIDICPNTPKGATVDAKGCTMDSDKDGVVDGLDRCPDTPRGDKVDANGCSEKAPEPLAGKASLVLEGVNFETNLAILTSSSLHILDGVVRSLKDWPEVNVEVDGHTDSSGASNFNKKLSQARADAVKNYLVSKGIDPARLTAKGYGSSRPLVDNKTPEGRAQNRRVELTRTN